MSDGKTNNNSGIELIDFSSSSSEVSSGEFYNPSVEFDSDDSRKNYIDQSEETLDRIKITLENVNRTITETTRLLRSNKNRTTDIKNKMSKSYMSIEQALKLIPIFDGENSDSNHAFQNSCEFALQNIDPELTAVLVRGITTRLIGKAYRAIRYKEVNNFSDLRTALNSLVDKKHTLAHLHSKLAMFKLAKGESIQQYADRAEQLYYDILEASSTTSGLIKMEGITTITSLQILNAFIEGLPHDTRIIVKARKPDTLMEAVQIALEEETSRTSKIEIHKNINEYRANNKGQLNRDSKPKYNNRTSTGACYQCGRMNHQASQCRASEADRARYRNSCYKERLDQRNVKIVTCKYCKKPNHTIEECRKRKFVNEKKTQRDQSLSGNEQTPGPSGSRPVGQIKTATLQLSGLSISKPN